MTWAPKFNSVRDEDLIDNLLGLITRDFKSALDVLYAGENLPDFREKALGQIKRLEFPCLALGPRRNASSPSDDDSRLGQAFEVDMYVGVSDDSSETVTAQIMKYMTTLGEVLRSASKSDVFNGMSGQIFGFVLETEWEYGPIGSNDSTLFRGAQMTVSITVNAR